MRGPANVGPFAHLEVAVLIVKVLRGNSPSDAAPIVVTSSPAVVRAVGEALARELAGDDVAVARALELVRDSAPGPV